MTAYRMVDEQRRVAAMTAAGVEICGAFQAVGHDYWTLFVTRLVSDEIGMQTPPHREHFWGSAGKACARTWVELIAALYSHERVTPKPVVVGDCSGALANIEETA